MYCGARRIISPISPGGISSTPFSASTMRTSTSGSGMPIEPILLVPCTGLTQHAIIPSVSEYPSISRAPVSDSNCVRVSAINAAAPEKQSLIEARLTLPARTSG